MKVLILPFLITCTFVNSQNCNFQLLEQNNSRSIYSIGEILTNEDQNIEFPICHSDGNIEGDFKFSNLNGFINGNYRIIIISMNATW